MLNISKEFQESGMNIKAVWCACGKHCAFEAAFSAKSFLDCGGQYAIIVVSTEHERIIVESIDTRVKVFISNTFIENYPKIQYQTFCLKFLFKNLKFYSNDFLIICDNNIIWSKFDKNKFTEMKFDLWFKESSFYNSRLLLSNLPLMQKQDSVVRTLINANKYIGCDYPLDVTLNTKLYGGRYNIIENIINELCYLLEKMQPDEVKLPDALLSYVVPNLRLTVCSDAQHLTVKFKKRKKTKTEKIYSPFFQDALNKLRSRDPKLSRIHFIH